MTSRLRVALIGGHTALARAIAEVVEERELDIEVRRYATLDAIDDGLELLGPEVLDASDLFVFTDDGELAQGLVVGARARKIPTLDLVGVDDEATLVWPVLTPEVDDHARIAPGLAGPIVGTLRALAILGPTRVVGSTYESAAIAGQPGMDDLLEQVRSVYSMKGVEASVFGDRLAFSALPASGLFDDELAKNVRAGLAADGPRVQLARALIPSLSAELAHLFIDLESTIDIEQIQAALADARGLRVVDDAPAAAEATERDDALVGALALDGDTLSLWLAADRLRGGGVTAAVLYLETWAAGRG